MLFSKRQKAAPNDVSVGDAETVSEEKLSSGNSIETIAADVPLSEIPLPTINFISHGAHSQNGGQDGAHNGNHNGAATLNGHATNGHATNGQAALSADAVTLRTLAVIEKMGEEIAALREETRHLHKVVRELSVQQSMQQNVFDTLHTELSDYKNDFVGARMKPVISTMLFLHDSMSGFRNEVGTLVDPPDWLGSKVLSKNLVEGNMLHFQDQMDEALRICEVEKIEVREGEVADAKSQKVVSVEPTHDTALDKRVQKVVRTGWTQGSKVFRPAEVAVWKAES